MISIGNFAIGKACGGKWFPRVGYGYWDGFRSFLVEPINLKFRTFQTGFAVGPLMFYKRNS